MSCHHTTVPRHRRSPRLAAGAPRPPADPRPALWPTLLPGLVELLLPTRCLLCGALPPGDPWRPGRLAAPVCPGCDADLPWLDGPEPAPPAAGLDGTFAALVYRYPVDRLVQAVKFQRRLALARSLGRLLAWRGLPPGLGPADGPMVLVPVPLPGDRQGERGFNQAEELARGAAGVLGLRVAARACRRLRPTPPQSGLGAAARFRNVAGAFGPGPDLARLPDLAATRFVVVDDVFTTGATGAAVARALGEGGARSVLLWTLARTLRRRGSSGWREAEGVVQDDAGKEGGPQGVVVPEGSQAGGGVPLPDAPVLPGQLDRDHRHGRQVPGAEV